MAPTKRSADETKVRGRPKKSRTLNLTPVVVDALCDAEALASDLQTVFEVALPTIFSLNKADRHAYESEVVEQAEKSLAGVLKSLEEDHSQCLSKQNEVTDPGEHARRSGVKKDAETGEQAAKKELEEKKEAKEEARKAVHSAQGDLKDAEKTLAKAEKEVQTFSDKKSSLVELLANEYVALKEGTCQGPAGKKAVKRLESIGKHAGMDDTMLQTLAITSKKDPANRSEFENMIFNSVKEAIDKQIDSMSQKVAELEPGKADRVAAVDTAKEALGKAEQALEAINEEVSAAQAKCKEAGKEVTKADQFLYEIWQDMKKACDAADDKEDAVKAFKDKVLPAFDQLKNKEPEASAAEDQAEDGDAAAEDEAEAMQGDEAPVES